MLKRIFDLFFSSIALIFVLPFCALLYLIVKLDSPGPFFFRQRRMGRKGKLFNMLKIRTMKTGSHRGTGITCKGDPRVTRLGKFLRKTKIDEMPQFINVFLGQMSVVGPRPDLPEYRDVGPDVWDQILTIKPGITHSSSIYYFNSEAIVPNDGSAEEFYRNVFLPKKQQIYLDCLPKQSIAYDLEIILKTAKCLISKKDFQALN